MRCQRLLVLSLLLSSCGGCECGDATVDIEPLRPSIARCMEALGEVRQRRAEATAWSPLAVGAELASGDWVQTAAAATARLDFHSGDQLEIGPSSVVVIEPHGESQGRELLAGQIDVKSGTVRGRVRATGGKRTLLVTTPDGAKVRLAAVSDEDPVDYRLTVREASGVELAVTKGRATVITADGNKADLEEGQAVDLKGGSVAGEVMAIPGAPELVAPGVDMTVGYEKGSPVRLSWTAVKGATEYVVEIASDPSFSSVVARERSSSPSLSFAPEKPGAYHWRVAGINAQGRAGEFGASRRVHASAGRIRDLLLTPADGTILAFEGGEPLVSFSWQASPVPSQYLLVVSKDELLDQSPALVEQSMETSLRTKALPIGDYYWGVFAVKPGQRTPLFEKPRRLSIRKDRAGLKVPRKLQWGR